MARLPNSVHLRLRKAEANKDTQAHTSVVIANQINLIYQLSNDAKVAGFGRIRRREIELTKVPPAGSSFRRVYDIAKEFKYIYSYKQCPLNLIRWNIWHANPVCVTLTKSSGTRVATLVGFDEEDLYELDPATGKVTILLDNDSITEAFICSA